MTIKFFRPVNGRPSDCRACKEKIFNKKEAIVMAASNNWDDKWSLHQECFCELREQINKINVFKVSGTGFDG